MSVEIYFGAGLSVMKQWANPIGFYECLGAKVGSDR
jgi:hypothetical protein